jgi:hypothetical protein
LDEGEVVLTWPRSISRRSFEEFDFWWQQIRRKAARSAGAEAG